MCISTYITDARAAWRLLNGVICVFKPLGMSSRRLQEEVRSKVVIGLNAMKVRDPEKMVEFRRIEGSSDSQNEPLQRHQPNLTEAVLQHQLNDGAKILTSKTKSAPPISNLEKSLAQEVIGEIEDGPDKIQIIKRANYADHTLVVGPRYQEEDIKIWNISRLGPNSSGLSGINRGIRKAQTLYHLRWLRTYVISGQFGIATNTGYYTGRIIDKTTFHRIEKRTFERFLATTQASHQKNMFEASGVPLKSDRAYEIASQGLPRPDDMSTPLIYSLKCTKFDLPNFDIEIAVVNENEEFLMSLIHDYGIRLHNAAVCTKIRCIKYGPFNLDLALLPKHYTPENFINNIIKTNEILETVDLKVRDPIVSNESADRSTRPPAETNARKVEYI